MDKEKKNKLKSLFQRKNKKNLPINSPMSSINTHINSLVNSRVQVVEELEQVFKKFDLNGDGKICSDELGSIMSSLGNPASEDEICSMIKEVDADGDGFIDLQEFIELNTKDIDTEELLANLRAAFSVFDLDKNGLISADELQKVFKNLGEECTLEQCKNMIKGADVNGDGLICFEEFKRMMMNGTRTPNAVASSVGANC